MFSQNLTVSEEIISYQQYVRECVSNKEVQLPEQLVTSVIQTNWENPETSLDFNNIAVMSLIEADNTQDMNERELFLEYALESLKAGIDLHNNLLCKAHEASIYCLVNDLDSLNNLLYSYFLDSIKAIDNSSDTSPSGLVYFPRSSKKWASICAESLPNILSMPSSDKQAFHLIIEQICHSNLSFYNSQGLRFLQLAVQFNNTSPSLNLQLGITSFSNQEFESLAYLHRARSLEPQNPNILHSLYLAYKDFQQPSQAEEYKKEAETLVYQPSLQLKWMDLDINSHFTYVPFEEDITLAVDSSFRSIATRVLIAQQDWFEVEIEFWRDQIKEGMTVIDIGANVGVYSFSAAKRVGKNGMVFAIEPFSSSILCLEETRRINQFEWVNIIAGAVTDRNGKASLSMHSASELNNLVANDESKQTNSIYEEVTCYTLDNLIEKQNINKIDWIKIDTEGHELQVFTGATRILHEFRPKIMYENIAGKTQLNINVADYLLREGYLLYSYTPYLKQLSPIRSLEDFDGKLNIIALPVPNRNIENNSILFRYTNEIIESNLSATEKSSLIPLDELYSPERTSLRIVLVVSGGLEEFIENTIISIQKCNIDLRDIEIFAPKSVIPSLINLLNKYSIGCINAIEDIVEQDMNLAEKDNYSDYGSSNFAKFTICKWLAIRSLFKRGIKHVIYTDVDIAWRNNPIQILEKIHNLYDVAMQTEGRFLKIISDNSTTKEDSVIENVNKNQIAVPIEFCTGFMSFVNSNSSLNLLEALIYKHMDCLRNHPDWHDQYVLNVLIADNFHLFSKIFPLSELLFANGSLAKSFFAKDEILDEIQIDELIDPLIFHANWVIGLDNKKTILKRTGNWFL